MITYSAPPFHQFEHPVPKIHILGRNVILMTAGSALLPSEFIYNIRIACSRRSTSSNATAAGSQKSIFDYVRVRDILGAVKEGFLRLRRRVIEERFLQKYDLKWEDYVNSIKSPAGPSPLTRIIAEIEEFRLELQAIIAGVDEEGPHIYVIEDPGIMNSFNDIGYAAIGSGAYHALRSFIENNYSIDMPLWKALYIIFEAKKYAESAPGVGTFTDAVVVGKEGVYILKEEHIHKLKELYDEKQKTYTELLSKLFETYKEDLTSIGNEVINNIGGKKGS